MSHNMKCWYPLGCVVGRLSKLHWEKDRFLSHYFLQCGDQCCVGGLYGSMPAITAKKIIGKI